MHSKRSPQPPRRSLVQWTLISEEGGRCGRDNMSIDYGMMRAAQQGAGYLRLYRWTPPCLSFGRNEPAATRYDVDEIRRLGLDTVRRCSCCRGRIDPPPRKSTSTARGYVAAAAGSASNASTGGQLQIKFRSPYAASTRPTAGQILWLRVAADGNAARSRE